LNGLWSYDFYEQRLRPIPLQAMSLPCRNTPVKRVNDRSMPDCRETFHNMRGFGVSGRN